MKARVKACCLLASWTAYTKRQAQIRSQCLLCELHAACATEQQIHSALRPFAPTATALQRLQDARPLDTSCISCNPTIISMHTAGVPPKVQQPGRKMLMQLRVTNREEVLGWCLHVFTDRSIWGQAEPAVPRRPATLNTFLSIASSR